MSGKIIMVVDDDLDLLENTAFMIRGMGHDVFTAKDGDEAVAKYKDIKPNLTFMDIRMPKMDGYDAFFKIKQHDPNAKVILITAYNQDEKKHLKAKSMALIDTINKPYSFETLEQLISKYA
ncbi:MAG: response regulator [Candidatus Nitrosotenuis sp.]|uniref:Response regulator receiver protein n=1 Tax=Candidatus Nitrosotenuis uzonensis TaxID=1407055 RepID=V6AV17_9ARCH|nr:response regulator [Candidatus Nitrosotenuis uzonensis]CAE6487816.1 Response regulator receiver protein [Candidatus Nitrosotenuis uzonensis]CDI06415.1 Response regulator receiver protein [Candidatus Nitrosotenuis uzonensis]